MAIMKWEGFYLSSELTKMAIFGLLESQVEFPIIESNSGGFSMVTNFDFVCTF